MASDLEMSLVDGGLTPTLAKMIAGALDHAATPKYTRGRAFGDATPVAKMRLVTPETRKYVLTNLDHSPEAPFSDAIKQQSGRYSPRDTRHPYEGSQPATAQGTLTTPSVAEGDYVTVTTAPNDSVTQAKVGLKIGDSGGRHARLDPAAKTVQSIPFSTDIAQEHFMQARFVDRPDDTVLKLALKNLQLYTVSGVGSFWAWKPQAGVTPVSGGPPPSESPPVAG